MTCQRKSYMYTCQHIDALKPNGLLYISWPLLLNICSLWTFPTSIIKPPGERIIKKAHRPYWFFKLPHTRTARRILLQTSQTRKFPALAATSAPYTTIGPVHQQMVLQHSPPDSINFKDKYASGRTRFNWSTRPKSASRRFQSFPSQDQHPNMKNKSMLRNPSPSPPFHKERSMAFFPQNFPSRCEPFQIAWSLLWRSLPKSNISRSRTLIISVDRSIDALNLLPSRFQRLILSNSALRRRCFVSILSQSLHFWVTGTVCMMSFIPHVSPVRYSLLQCCRKCPHFQSPQANRCWSKKHMFDFFYAFWYPIVSVISYQFRFLVLLTWEIWWILWALVLV